MKFFLTILLTTYFSSCNLLVTDNSILDNSISVRILSLPDTSFAIINGLAIYQQKLFTGTTEEVYKSGKTFKSVEYKTGKEDGITSTYYEDGKSETKRYYLKGEKEGLHQGWWPNGNKRFQYQFAKGNYNGAFIEYYENGTIAKEIHYSNGIETDGKGWRENGKVYMSFVMKEGRRYGLVNSKLCYSLKNEQGEYIKSVAAE